MPASALWTEVEDHDFTVANLRRFITAPKPYVRAGGGLVADLLLFGTNLLFLTPIAAWITLRVQNAVTSNDPSVARILAAVLALVVVLQAVGAFLKRGPLQARLAQRGVSSNMGCLGIVLLMFNYILTLFALAAILTLMGYTVESNPIPLFAVIALAVVPTYLVQRALSPMRSTRKQVRTSPHVEWVADALLLPYVIANTLVFNYITSITGTRATSFEGEVMNLSSMVLVVFIVFIWYLPPRLLFLVEDYRDLGTWIRIVVAMAPVAWRWAMG